MGRGLDSIKDFCTDLLGSFRVCVHLPRYFGVKLWSLENENTKCYSNIKRFLLVLIKKKRIIIAKQCGRFFDVHLPELQTI